MLTVRYATLADTQAIHEIHRSDVTEWKASYFDETGARHKRIATWEECSLLDRWEQGGAWMSPELCAIHLNRMLQEGNIPLVAEVDGQVVGELELFLEHDGEYGFHANLSVLYLHAEQRGRGIGGLMMQDACELLQQIGCEALLTYNPAVPEFYKRYGLVLQEEQVQLIVATERYDTAWIPRTTSIAKQNSGHGLSLFEKTIQSGRILSNQQLLQLLKDEEEPGFYTLDFHLRPAEMSFRLSHGSDKAFCVFRDINGLYENAIVHLWADELERSTLRSILNRAARLGISQLTFQVKPEQEVLFTDFSVIHRESGTKIYYKDLL